MRKMKKVLSAVLAATMVMSMSMTAFAEETKTYPDTSTVTVSKTYKLTNASTKNPAETFEFFGLTCTGVENAAVGITKDNAPMPTLGAVAYEGGEATSKGATKNITITLPDYTGVGVYTYTFKEVDNGTAGVTYYGKDITLVVTVIEQDGKVRVAAVHTEGEGEAKSSAFDNVYSAGSLSVGKTVTGILGDKKKEFDVKVTFTAPTGDAVKGDIEYVDGTETLKIAADDWTDGKVEKSITLKDGETVNFTNIPYGVEYVVSESDYTGDGYDAAVYDANKSGIIKAASVNTMITNNKGGKVDTGINLDNMPYILLLAVAVLGVFGFVFRKRSSEF